ncbi:DNA protection during starvation protein 1 [Paraliobacillus sp. PM-2]|uniref:Dps family protein n=1 Tax=Paraliobacillus sp. PM-2 TaxID=1462524 RepID=UPI00061CCC3A|nr:Dps family protein [Paraliobacillus sp. PM-2]CQR47395.1 DNA protection during starvation protein 1 [Paraliobacillus sp. PM-2]
MNKKQLVDELNMQLANWNVLDTKLHAYHWYVTGPDFFVLHEKFEAWYNEAAEYIDELAERILTIGDKPIASMKEYLKHSSLEEATGEESTKEMVQQLKEDFTRVVSESKEIVQMAEELGDQPTADFFIGVTATLQKHIWMMNAYLN